MIEIEFDFEEMPRWYGISRIYETDVAAGEAFALLNEYDTTGRLNIGVYRHMRLGLDPGPVIVSIVGVDPETVLEAGEVLGGRDLELHPATWLQLVKRRAEVVIRLDAEGAGSGRHRIEHSPEGDVIE